MDASVQKKEFKMKQYADMLIRVVFLSPAKQSRRQA
jgi:hypothetical protein